MTPPDTRDILLVAELRRLGDAVLSLPFIRGAEARYAVHVLCPPASVPLFETILPRDRIHPAPPPWMPPGLSAWPAFLKGILTVRALRPRTAVCGWADARAEWTMRLTGAPRRLGFPMTPGNYYAPHVPWRRRHLRHGRWLSRAGGLLTGRPLLTDPLARADPAQPHLDDWRQAAEALNLRLETGLPWLKPDPAALRPALAEALKQARAAGQPLWLVHPGAGSEVKKWGDRRFDSLLRSWFIPRAVPCVVVQPPGSPPLPASGPALIPADPRDLPELMALADAVDAVVCNDSAISHLAAALGKRVVSVFGPSDPQLFAPFGNEGNVIIRGTCVFRPCMDRCLQAAPTCMESIRVEDVEAVVARVQAELENTSGGRSAP